jgi:hypothetical protein
VRVPGPSGRREYQCSPAPLVNTDLLEVGLENSEICSAFAFRFVSDQLFLSMGLAGTAGDLPSRKVRHYNSVGSAPLRTTMVILEWQWSQGSTPLGDP